MDHMEKSYSRREFLRTAGAAGAGSLITTTVANAGTPFAPGVPDSPRVRTRAFGKTGVRVSMLGLGGYFGFTTHSNMEQCMKGAAKLGWIDGIVTTYNYRLMHGKAMKQAVKECAKAGIGLVAIKSQAAMAHPTATVGVETETSLALAHRFMAKGFTLHQAKLKAIWENPLISSTFSMMPNTTILMANAAAAMDRTALSSRDMELLKTYANETLSCYCAGCARICESVAPNHIPIAKVMRCLMYYHAYNDYEKARSCYHRLPIEIRQEIVTADYSIAELRCPNRLAIGELLRRASQELA